jgi:hypothetical protein
MDKLLQISLFNSLTEGYVSIGSLTSCPADLPGQAYTCVAQMTQNKKEPN